MQQSRWYSQGCHLFSGLWFWMMGQQLPTADPGRTGPQEQQREPQRSSCLFLDLATEVMGWKEDDEDWLQVWPPVFSQLLSHWGLV